MITIQKRGRLGNHLFQYAVCREVAERNGFNFYFPDVSEIKKIFPKIDQGKKDGEVKEKYRENKFQEYNSDIFKISDFTELDGYFQSEKYLNRERVRKWFNIIPNEKSIEISKKYPVEEYVYIHTRGGDYSSKVRLSKKYFDDSLSKIKGLKSNLKPLIISSDKNFSKSLIPNAPIINHNLETDFYLLYLAKYIIISNSSFSWWASWLQDNNTIIAPSKWIGMGAKDNKSPYPNDIISNKFITV